MIKLSDLSIADIDLSKSYSYADYYGWQIDERLELINGKVYVLSPAPTTNHQILTGYIFNRLSDFLEDKGCNVFISPFDVRLPGKSKEDKDITTVVQPDICVVCDKSKIDERGCIGAPDIMVEILSPGSSKKDLKQKQEVYEQSGVREYWVISPQNQWCIIYTLIDGKYNLSGPFVEGEFITSTVLPGFTLNLSTLFDKLI